MGSRRLIKVISAIVKSGMKDDVRKLSGPGRSPNKEYKVGGPRMAWCSGFR